MYKDGKEWEKKGALPMAAKQWELSQFTVTCSPGESNRFTTEKTFTQLNHCSPLACFNSFLPHRYLCSLTSATWDLLCFLSQFPLKTGSASAASSSFCSCTIGRIQARLLKLTPVTVYVLRPGLSSYTLHDAILMPFADLHGTVHAWGENVQSQ